MTTTPQTNTTLAEIAERMRELDDFVLCGHVSPDGDCIGSQLTLWHALRALGKRATCVLVRDEPAPSELMFLPGAELMIPAAQFKGEASTFVACDVPTRERIGAAACKILDGCTASFTIDHHPSDAAMTDYLYADVDAASASMLLWKIAKLLLDEPPIECALSAFVGLTTDTGGFRFQNSDERAFACAGELVSYGVDPAYVSSKVFQNRTLASLNLEALTIQRIEVLAEGEAALSYVLMSDFEKFGAVKSDAEPLVDAVRSLEGVRIACMLREQDGVVRGSLRAKDDTDVSELARECGGGGHKAAAGFTLDMTMDEARAFMRDKVVELTIESRTS